MKAMVLSSGGIDSTTCLALAVKKYGSGNVVAVSCWYGQKHSKEIECAKDVARHYNVEHYFLNLSEILQYSSCSLLTSSSKEIDHRSYAEQIEKSGKVDTYVPFRNGLMLSAVAALAVSLFPDEETEVYIGAHADDSAGNAYPDCSPEFTSCMAEAIRLGTYGHVMLYAPLVRMNKAEVVGTGLRLGVPYHMTWSCYEGGEKPCGQCATCRDRQKAFRENGQKDPVL